MTSERDLHPEDKAHLWALVDPIIARFDEAGDANLHRMAVEAIAALNRLAADGERWAEHPLRLCAIDGMRGLIRRHLKADRGTVRIAHTGAVIDLPARMGIEVPNPKPPPQRIYQQPLWWELTWAQFDAMLTSLRAQRNRLSSEVMALLEIQGLRDRYPQSRTPGEACLMAGIDPRQFEGTGTNG